MIFSGYNAKKHEFEVTKILTDESSIHFANHGQGFEAPNSPNNDRRTRTGHKPSQTPRDLGWNGKGSLDFSRWDPPTSSFNRHDVATSLLLLYFYLFIGILNYFWDTRLRLLLFLSKLNATNNVLHDSKSRLRLERYNRIFNI